MLNCYNFLFTVVLSRSQIGSSLRKYSCKCCTGAKLSTIKNLCFSIVRMYSHISLIPFNDHGYTVFPLTSYIIPSLIYITCQFVLLNTIPTIAVFRYFDLRYSTTHIHDLTDSSSRVSCDDLLNSVADWNTSSCLLSISVKSIL